MAKLIINEILKVFGGFTISKPHSDRNLIWKDCRCYKPGDGIAYPLLANLLVQLRRCYKTGNIGIVKWNEMGRAK
jgi:hypothetical protein